MKLLRLEMVGDDWSEAGTSPLVAKAKIKTDSRLVIEVKFTPEMSVELAQAAAEIVGRMMGAAGPHLHKERMDNPQALLEAPLDV